MPETPDPAKATPPQATPPQVSPNRGLWIDELGNVHGIIMTVEVNPKYVFEFNEKAINYPPGTRREDLKG